uniref:Ig-like domain-containing protein n=1 Tax=Labrus bergylta TaxID=56723 RepID=A0A3Q3EC55_9LABR
MTTGVWSEIRLEQSPSEVKRPGETVKMSCIISGFDMTSYYIHWIRQKPGRALEWIGGWILAAIGGIKYYSTSVKNRFTISRDNDVDQVYLHMNSLTAEDSAVYYYVTCSCVLLSVFANRVMLKRAPVMSPVSVIVKNNIHVSILFCLS